MSICYVNNTLSPYAGAVGTAQGGTADGIRLAEEATETPNAFNAFGILITGGTGVGQQRYIINYSGETKIATVHADWEVAPDASSTYEITFGSDAFDGLGPGSLAGGHGAFRTLHKAKDIAADGDRIFVKGGRHYTDRDAAGDAVLQINRAIHNVIVEGYTVSPGDGGQAMIDCGPASAAYGVMAGHSGCGRWRFNNLVVLNALNGFELVVSDNGAFYLNSRCEARDCANIGVNIGVRNCILDRCTSRENDIGFRLGSTGARLIGCTARGNHDVEFSAAASGGGNSILFCRMFDVPSATASLQLAEGDMAIGNTLDGEGLGSKGIECAGAVVVLDNLVHDYAVGLSGAGEPAFALHGWNLFSRCAAAREGWTAGEGEAEGEARFINEQADDYRPAAGSPAGGAGFPEHMDIGAFQRRATSSFAAGLLSGGGM